MRVLAEYGWCWPSKAKYEGGQSIAYKYRKGKLKSTSNEELKEHEIRPVRIRDPVPSKSAGGGTRVPPPSGTQYDTAAARGPPVPLGPVSTGELLRGHVGRDFTGPNV